MFVNASWLPKSVLLLRNDSRDEFVADLLAGLTVGLVADRMGGDRHNPNVELIAQGIANIASPLVGGLPATGAIARTATNIRSGARTPASGMIHALTLLMVLLVAAPASSFHPACGARGHPPRRRVQRRGLGGNP
jgi:MFS superfamily sulfate permease-like transporter